MTTLAELIDHLRDQAVAHAKKEGSDPGAVFIFAVWPGSTMTFCACPDERLASTIQGATDVAAEVLIRELRKGLVVS